ncbi:nuclear transport factor 2 family protein [Streptomyces sp. NPDC021608]|uniref:YybH family protein n=1 Tax=Streptomyces sp. NPDC021608 TaxID=3154903 RepID=UPI0033E41093
MKPEAVQERFAQYLEHQDLDGLESLFDEHAMFIPGPGPGPGQELVYGREGIKEALKPYLVSPSTIEVVVTAVHQNGDLAMLQPSWRITSESGTVEGKAVEVGRRARGTGSTSSTTPTASDPRHPGIAVGRRNLATAAKAAAAFSMRPPLAFQRR